jgi:accessory gene regulator B
MNIIEKASLSLAKSIRANYPEAASEEVLKFSLNILINSVSSIIISLLVCLITGHFSAGILAILSYTLLRIFSGGVHLSSSITCCILSIIIFISSSHLVYNYFDLGLILDLTSIGIILFTAPSRIEQVTRIDPKYYPVLKIISIMIIFTNFFIQSHIISTSFFIQSLLTTPISYKVVYFLERRHYHEKNHSKTI